MSEPNGTPEFDESRMPRGFYHYRGSIPLMDLPVQEGPGSEDYQWAIRNRELHRQYQGMVVAVHNQKVWGVGKDENAARDDALQKPGCPYSYELTLLRVVGMPGSPLIGSEEPRE
jgi:hypothetical protein